MPIKRDPVMEGSDGDASPGGPPNLRRVQLIRKGALLLALVGLVAVRDRGNLHMAELSGQRFDQLGQIAVGDLGMIDIKLHLDVWPVDPCHQRLGLALRQQEIAGHVAGVERFRQHRDAVFGTAVGGMAHTPDEVLEVASIVPAAQVLALAVMRAAKLME